MQDLVCRGERMVILEGKQPKYDMLLRDWIVDLGHVSHQGMEATKRPLRHRLWFLGMDDRWRVVERCLPCQASVDKHTRDPLKPNRAPEEPWQQLYADYWGPTSGGKHILVVIDGLTRYPEVVVVKGHLAGAQHWRLL